MLPVIDRVMGNFFQPLLDAFVIKTRNRIGMTVCDSFVYGVISQKFGRVLGISMLICMQYVRPSINDVTHVRGLSIM